MKKNFKERMIVKEWMVNSLLQIMKAIPYDDITITQITNKAGVSRMTYYRNYLSKDEILASYAEYLTEEFASLTRSIKGINNRKYLKVLFDFCLKYKDYICTLIKAKKSYIILEAINKNIDIITNDNDNIPIKYYAGAIFNVLISWLQNGAKESSEEMSEKLGNLINSDTFIQVIRLYNDFFKELD